MSKFLELFTPIQKGNFGLTDEAIYKSIQNEGQFIPVFGGTQTHEVNRLIPESGKTIYDEPITIFDGEGVIISLDGSSGSMTYHPSGKFALNHHAGFFKAIGGGQTQIISEFFSLFYEKQLQEASISEGSKTLTLDTIYSLDFDLPEYPTQNKIMEAIKPILQNKGEVESIRDRLDSILNRTLSIEYNQYQAQNIPVNGILDCFSGNNGLTEEEIYHHVLLQGERYEVLSSSTEESTRLGMIPMCRIDGKWLKVFAGKKGVLVVRNGKAGSTYFLENGKYTITDHAYILALKEGSPYSISLKWLMYNYRQLFFEYTSSSDNATWNMTDFFKETYIDIPSENEQLEVVKKYELLELLRNKIDSITSRIDKVFTRQIAA